MPAYPDAEALGRVERALGTAEAVADPADSARLVEAMTAAAAGDAFVLQGGDCAESFADDVAENVAGVSGLFAQMAAILRQGIGVPIIEIARIAGQFAKPRTTDVETRGNAALPAYRGDIVNGAGFDAALRSPDPDRMLKAHRQSLETARRLVDCGAATIFTSHEALLLPYEQALTRCVEGRWWATSGHMLWLGDRTRQLDGAQVE
jgi:3-deoxy-7-phosphoheptulonate synthase